MRNDNNALPCVHGRDPGDESTHHDPDTTKKPTDPKDPQSSLAQSYGNLPPPPISYLFLNPKRPLSGDPEEKKSDGQSYPQSKL